MNKIVSFLYVSDIKKCAAQNVLTPPPNLKIVPTALDDHLYLPRSAVLRWTLDRCSHHLY